MTYDRYDRLCAYYRGLRGLINSRKDGLTPHQKFRLLGEIKDIQTRIKKAEKILSIQTKGDWEFSTLAQNYVFWPVRIEPVPIFQSEGQWADIKNDPKKLEVHNLKRRERQKLKRAMKK